ncbi:hypothetical protein [Massilia sp. X63]|jgi:hypothetical protein|uniref:hypothetical protein n=1 Tax=Massilia sp. X63 TaxID=3237285 RepID=UPI0034DD1999
MSERQKRTDIHTANVVMRGVNILLVRDPVVARKYMEYKHVPAHVIERVLDYPTLRRMPSAEQLRSEAITPFPPAPDDD